MSDFFDVFKFTRFEQSLKTKNKSISKKQCRWFRQAQPPALFYFTKSVRLLQRETQADTGIGVGRSER